MNGFEFWDFLEIPGMQRFNAREKLNEYFRDIMERRRDYLAANETRRSRRAKEKKNEIFPLFLEEIEKGTP